MFGNIRAISDQQGFSMAEVVIAVILFSAAVIGISGLVMTGASDVARGASDSVAANLATKRIEEVRSLVFYKPWEGTPKDIDDHYYNQDVPNAQQIDHPEVDEGYGSIPGNPKYRRTTAIQYQQASGTGMATAEMATNWVPSSPTGTQFDRPKNKAGDALHAMIIEVCVYYNISQGGTQHEVVYKERALEGDMIIPGGASAAPLTITSIDPVWANTSNNNVTMKVYVSSSDSITKPGQTFDVTLWRAGSNDIVGTGTTVIGESEIDTHFNLTKSGIGLGLYNISVYWEQRGWLDKDLRSCFTVVPPNPVISSVDNFNWGTTRQNSRQVTIHGYNLKSPTTVSLLGPSSATISGTVVSSNATTIVVKFNLTSVPASQHSIRWDVKVVGTGGTGVSDADSKRVLMNPLPVVTGIALTPGSSDPQFYRKKIYTNVTVSGRYFGGVGGALPTVKLTKSGRTDITGSNVVIGSVNETSDTTMTLTLNTLNLSLSSSDGAGPFTSGNSANENGNWKVVVVNPDSQLSTDNIYATVANAPIEITEGWDPQQSWSWDLPITVTGKYFDPDNTTVNLVDSSGNAVDPDGVSTVTDTQEPSGIYDGSPQYIGGGHLNLIHVPAATYKIRVKDTENNQYVDRDISVTYQAPDTPEDISPSQVTNGTTATLTVTAKGLYGSACTYTVKFWHMSSGVHDSDQIVTSPAVTPTYSRADEYVKITASITVPAGDAFKTSNGALPEIMVTNPIDSSPYWTGGHPQVI